MIPSLFISHGSPVLAIQDNAYTRFLQETGKRIVPEAIVIFTPHWESEVTTITFIDDVYETIYDFGGFVKELYEVEYQAKGSIKTAILIEEKFRNHGIETSRDEKRGLDHGSWVILRHLYPDAEIPVVQVSVHPFLEAEKQFEIGRALGSLGKENILVIGSGVTVHNLRTLNRTQTTAEAWAVAFDDWLIEKMLKQDRDSLFQYEQLAPYARLAVPTTEHFMPLFIAMGSGSTDRSPDLLYRGYIYGTCSLLAFEF